MHLNWFLQITNLRSLTKAPLFPLENGQLRSWHKLLKDGRPYFCQWKSSSHTRKNSIPLNFETKEQRRLKLYAFELILTNIQSELIDKSTIISTRRWTNSLGTAHSKMGGPTFVKEKVVHKLEKK